MLKHEIIHIQNQKDYINEGDIFHLLFKKEIYDHDLFNMYLFKKIKKYIDCHVNITHVYLHDLVINFNYYSNIHIKDMTLNNKFKILTFLDSIGLHFMTYNRIIHKYYNFFIVKFKYKEILDNSSYLIYNNGTQINQNTQSTRFKII